jgi:predicted transcriptional regulator YheO
MSKDTLRCKKCKIALIDYKENGLLCLNCDWKKVSEIAIPLTLKMDEKAKEIEKNLFNKTFN